jgi:Mg-chelatase subunit ChlD
VEFVDLAKVSIGFTGHTEEIRSALKNVQAGGLTAMLDAIDIGLLEMKKAKNSRKAIVIVSDGGDNRSHYTAAQTQTRDRKTYNYPVQVSARAQFPSREPTVVICALSLASYAQQISVARFR